MNNRMLVLLAGSLLLFAACKRSTPTVTTTVPSPKAAVTVTALEVEGTTASTSGAAGGASGAVEATPTPLALDEAGLKKYLAYRKELAALVRDSRKKMLAASGKGDAVAQAKDFAVISSELDKGTDALHTKYGITKDQDDATFEAAQAVVTGAITKNSMMASSVADLRKAAAEDGPAGASAKASLAGIEGREKASLDEARKKFGSAAVDLLLAHYAEIDQMHVEAMNAAMGQ